MNVSFNGFLYNPAFIFEDCPLSEITRLRLNGKSLDESEYSLGKTSGGDLVLFLFNYSEKGFSLSVSFN